MPDAHAETSEKQWVLLDAEGAKVGRLAAFVATRLRGKHRPDYAPHRDCGDGVILINAKKVLFTGKKMQNKIYYRHTGHPGGIKKTTPEKLLEGEHPQRVLANAIRRMMPDGPLARQQLRNLKIYPDAAHPHEAQKPETLDFLAMNRKNGVPPSSEAQSDG